MDSIFLTIFFFIFTLVCAKNIRYGIFVVIFLMPLYLLRFSILGIPTTVLEVMIYILFLVWIVNKISKQYHILGNGTVYEDVIKRNNFYNNNILLIGIFLLFLGLTISTFNSSDLKTSMGICKGWFVDPFLFFIVFVSVLKKNKQRMLAFKSWLFSGVAVSAISIFCLLNNNLTFDGRLKAFFLSPNHLAMYLAPAFLLALFFLLNKKVLSIKHQILSLFLLIIISIPLFFTYSYGAFLGIFAGAIWLFYKAYKFKIGKFYFSKQYLSFPPRIGARGKLQRESTITMNNKLGNKPKTSKQAFLKIITLIILVIFISITAIKFNQIINSESRSSLHSRLMIWKVAGEIIKDNPITGIGPGTFQETYLSYSEKFAEPYLEWAVPQPHNIFLAFYLQTGLIGFVGFILILIWFFHSSFVISKRNRSGVRNPLTLLAIIFSQIRDSSIAAAHFGMTKDCNSFEMTKSEKFKTRAPYIINALMIYILIHGLVDTTYWKNDLALSFWLILGGLTSFKMYDKMRGQGEEGENIEK